jgi:hypothetical protein
MNDNMRTLFDVIRITAVLFCAVGFFCKMTEVLHLKKEAIRLGYASYNPTNGNWQWHVAK